MADITTLQQGFKALAAALAATLALSASGAACAQASGSTARGAAVADRYCGGCHATGAAGDSVVAKAPVFRELHKRFMVQDLEDHLMIQLLNSHVDMPRFNLSAEELTDLIAYLKIVQTRKTASLGPAPRG